MQACQGCTIDFIAVHFYGPSDGLKQYVTQIHTNYSKPIWVTEFGFPNTPADQVVTSLQDSIQFFESSSFVTRYSYFCAFRAGEGNSFVGQDGAFLDQNGQVNDGGKASLH